MGPVSEFGVQGFGTETANRHEIGKARSQFDERPQHSGRLQPIISQAVDLVFSKVHG